MVVTWQETCCERKDLPFHTLSVDICGVVVASMFLIEPTPLDVMRHVLLALNPRRRTGPAPTLPGNVLISARMAHVARPCGVLFDLLGVPFSVESWRAALDSALDNDTSPWGHNAFSRCVACRGSRIDILPIRGVRERRVQSLKRCSGCNVAHYCSVECRDKDWSTHRDMCRYAQDRAKGARAYNNPEHIAAVQAIATAMGMDVPGLAMPMSGTRM